MRNFVIRKIDWTSYDDAEHAMSFLRPHVASARRVLDLSCGEAIGARMIQAEFPNVFVLGADLFDRRRTAFAPFLRYGGHLPVADGAFDLTVVAFVLHHVPPGDRDALFDEVLRVTGGTLVIFEDTPRNAIDRWVSARHARCYDHQKGGPGAGWGFLTEEQWLRYFERRGLRLLSSRRLGRFCRSPFKPYARCVFALQR